MLGACLGPSLRSQEPRGPLVLEALESKSQRDLGAPMSMGLEEEYTPTPGGKMATPCSTFWLCLFTTPSTLSSQGHGAHPSSLAHRLNHQSISCDQLASLGTMLGPEDKDAPP